MATEKATGVALTESVIKMGLYYFHERFWYANLILDCQPHEKTNKKIANGKKYYSTKL